MSNLAKVKKGNARWWSEWSFVLYVITPGDVVDERGDLPTGPSIQPGHHGQTPPALGIALCCRQSGSKSASQERGTRWSSDAVILELVHSIGAGYFDRDFAAAAKARSNKEVVLIC